jgi:hypothetical protein
LMFRCAYIPTQGMSPEVRKDFETAIGRVTT